MTSSLHAGGGEDRARRRRPLGRGAPTRNDAGEPGGKRLAGFVSWRQAGRRALASLAAPDDAALAIRFHVDLDLQVEVDLVLRRLPDVAQRVLLLIKEPLLVGLILRVCMCLFVCIYFNV